MLKMGGILLLLYETKLGLRIQGLQMQGYVK